ncbi:MAG TPA: voltage-gated chloride channel family protein [Tepidisphaeraceae bacterium]|jgi:H+/Cl- antiporter ClcA
MPGKPQLHSIVAIAMLVTLTAALIGTAVAIFLWSLDHVTRLRFDYPWLLWTLPLVGGAVGLLYHFIGGAADRGNNLIIEQIHEPGGGVPRRMTPLVLLGTLLTHLGGGSAGREGTAVQMGGSIAGALCRHLRLSPEVTGVLLMSGVAAGFGAVFGTPWAGAVFAIEVLTVGRLRYRAIVPCLLAAFVGDRVCMAWDVHWLGLHFQAHHTNYRLDALTGTATPTIMAMLLAKVVAAAVLFGLASLLFAEMTHGVSALFRRFIAWPPLRPVVGGCVVIALVYLVGTRDYLGLGVTPDPHHADGVSIVSSFHAGGATPWSWAWKTVFTAVTLGSGFKGGEVTPLFFVGATLGHALAGLFDAPFELFAALGFVAVFAGATNTPLACTIMGIELFGGTATTPGLVLYLAVACWVAYACSGRTGIYLSQRVGEKTLRELRG